MLNNCAGGYTPWGTVLTCEENFNQYFANVGTCPDPVAQGRPRRLRRPAGGARAPLGAGLPDPLRHGRRTARAVEVRLRRRDRPVRSDLGAGEAHRARPHQARGRQHLARAATAASSSTPATTSASSTSTSSSPTAPTTRRPGREPRRCSRRGTLYVARFDADGTGAWLPMVYAGNEAALERPRASPARPTSACTPARPPRRSAPPRWTAPRTSRSTRSTATCTWRCTNNTNRGTGASPVATPPTPRAPTSYGHIIEMVEAGNDHAAHDVHVGRVHALRPRRERRQPRGRRPAAATPTEQTYFAGWTGLSTLISCPDNLAFDQAGNLIVGTDGMPGSGRRHRRRVRRARRPAPTAGASCSSPPCRPAPRSPGRSCRPTTRRCSSRCSTPVRAATFPAA